MHYEIENRQTLERVKDGNGEPLRFKSEQAALRYIKDANMSEGHAWVQVLPIRQKEGKS